MKLVLANADLVSNYMELFKEKQEKADPRVVFEWLSMATFKQHLLEDPAQFTKDCIIVDEGDTLLV